MIVETIDIFDPKPRKNITPKLNILQTTSVLAYDNYTAANQIEELSVGYD